MNALLRENASNNWPDECFKFRNFRLITKLLKKTHTRFKFTLRFTFRYAVITLPSFWGMDYRNAPEPIWLNPPFVDFALQRGGYLGGNFSLPVLT